MKLRGTIDAGAVFFTEDFDETKNERVVLSTIHRSKGKEYDTVIVVSGDEPPVDAGSIDAETRVLFVALTRAKSRLFRIERTFNSIRMTDDNDRCARYTRRKGSTNSFFTGIQIGLLQDIDDSSFASTKTAATISQLVELQRFIVEEIRPGDPARVVLTDFAQGCPIYDLFVKDRKTGRMTTDFGWALWRALRYAQKGFPPRRFPEQLSEFWVKEVVTVVGDLSRDDVPREYRNSGLWNGIRVEGLASTSGTDWRER
jgi:hypothetical protein